MSNTDQMKAIVRDPDLLPRYAQYGLLSVVIGLGATGWLTAVPYGGIVMALIGAFLEVHVFFGLPKWLDHLRNGQIAKLWLLGAILAMAALVNSIGLDYGLRFLGSSTQAPLDAQVRAEQQEIDNRRAAALLRVSELQTLLDQHLAQTPPDAETTVSQRQQTWQRNFETRERALRQSVASARGDLDQIPLTATERRAYPEWARHVAAGFLLFISVFVRFAWGFDASTSSQKQRPSSPRPKPSHQGENIVDLGTARDTKRDIETVLRLHKAGYSVRRIAAETGISKSRAQRLLAAQ